MTHSVPVVPPGNAARLMGMHWLQMRSPYDAGVSGFVALQWNPGSQTWTHSNEHDRHPPRPVETTGWLYMCAIPHPFDLMEGLS